MQELSTQQVPHRRPLPLEERSHSQEAARRRGIFTRKPAATGAIVFREQGVRDPASIRSPLFRFRVLSVGAWTANGEEHAWSEAGRRRRREVRSVNEEVLGWSEVAVQGVTRASVVSTVPVVRQV